MGWAMRRMGVGALILGLAFTCGGGKSVPQPAPSVTTGAADGLTPHSAVLHGRATGNGTSGSASFRFGGDPALGILNSQGQHRGIRIFSEKGKTNINGLTAMNSISIIMNC